MNSFRKYLTVNEMTKNKSVRSNHVADYNSSVVAKGKKETRGFESNIEKYIKFISWARWYP